ncbi:MAG: hypothetical protein HUJ90_00840, partial [Bacteroidales bacterium]|nr:hypothetical protein [Bacteroidales bacterium]
MLQQEQIGAGLQLPEKLQLPNYDSDTINTEPHRDTIMVVDDYTGKKLYLMNAVEDMDGEMVAHDELQAAYVTARFRNVAERNGKVGIEFQLVVPQSMQDSKWQIRFHPLMYILQDTVKLDDVIITGNEYRKQQLRGYQQYERFLSRIINDNSAFVDLFQLEQFLRRNIPQIYAFKRDSSFVSDE